MTAILERTKTAIASTRSGVSEASSGLPPAAKYAIAAAATLAVYLVANAVLPNNLPIGIVVLGAVFGSFYALTAIGLVLIYRANRVVNFAQADVGAVGGVLAIEFALHGLHYFVAIF